MRRRPCARPSWRPETARLSAVDYDHTQKAPLHWLLAIPGAAMLVSVWYAPEPPGPAAVLSIVGAIMVALSFCFRELRVRAGEDRLRIAFGPVHLFRNTLRYDQILAARADRSRWYEGWGIHRWPGRGWLWNLWGLDCVALALRDGTTLRIGTDDVAGLVAHVQTRTRQEAA